MRYDRLTTAEQQATVLAGLKNLEAQALQTEMDIEVNAGDAATVAALTTKLQALAGGIAAIRKRWKVLLAYTPPQDALSERRK